jgi:MoxR-like ATPase
LPDAFLRRCVYYHIPFPEQERLEEIVALQLEDFPTNSALIRDAIALFVELREPRGGLRKKPATAELLLWLLTLRRLLGDAAHSTGLKAPAHRKVVGRSLSSLIKTADDRVLAQRVVSQWLAS